MSATKSTVDFVPGLTLQHDVPITSQSGRRTSSSYRHINQVAGAVYCRRSCISRPRASADVHVGRQRHS